MCDRLSFAARQAELLAKGLGYDGQVFDTIEVWTVGPRHVRVMFIGYELNLAGNLGDAVDIGCIEIAFRNSKGLKLNPFDLVWDTGFLRYSF